MCFYIFMFGYLSFAKGYHLKEVKINTLQREKHIQHTYLFCKCFPCILLCSHLSSSRLCDDNHSGQRSDHILHCSHFRNILLHILLKKKLLISIGVISIEMMSRVHVMEVFLHYYFIMIMAKQLFKKNIIHFVPSNVHQLL